MDKYLKAIKLNVCAICVDSNERGGCTLTEKETCAVELYLPQIVEIIHDSENETVGEIYLKLKDKICGHCRNDETGLCYLREDSNCSLDRYFPLIVEVIRKEDK